MNQSFWRRFWAIPVEIVIELIHLFYKRERCKPILSKTIYRLKVTIYFTFPVFVFLSISWAWLNLATEAFFNRIGILDFLIITLGATIGICWVIYRFTFRPDDDFYHPSGKPEYVAEDSCVQVYRCKLCPHVDILPELHILGNWEDVAQGSCEKHRRCMRCDHVVVQAIVHSFTDWAYISEDNCDQTRVCVRDGTRENRQGVHKFSDWKYVADGKCDLRRICSRCGEKEDLAEQHIPASQGDPGWLEYDCSTSCVRCGKPLAIPDDPSAMSEEQRLEYINTFT